MAPCQPDGGDRCSVSCPAKQPAIQGLRHEKRGELARARTVSMPDGKGGLRQSGLEHLQRLERKPTQNAECDRAASYGRVPELSDLSSYTKSRRLKLWLCVGSERNRKVAIGALLGKGLDRTAFDCGNCTNQFSWRDEAETTLRQLWDDEIWAHSAQVVSSPVLSEEVLGSVSQ